MIRFHPTNDFIKHKINFQMGPLVRDPGAGRFQAGMEGKRRRGLFTSNCKCADVLNYFLNSPYDDQSYANTEETLGFR